MAENELVTFEPNIEVNPTPIKINNLEQLEMAVNGVVTKYGQDFVVTTDNVADTKKMRANINKIAKSINDKRLETDRQYKKPMADFDKLMKGLGDKVKNLLDPLDSKIEEVETQERQARYDSVKAEIAEMAPNYGVSATDIEIQPGWLLKSLSHKKLLEQIAEAMTQLRKDRDQRATDIQTVRMYADQLELESSGWAALISKGEPVSDILAEMDAAAVKRDKERQQKAEKAKAAKEAQAAIDATHQVKQGDETIDTDTGEVIPQTITVKLTGTHKALGQVWAGAKNLGVRIELVDKED
ncbi:DUF1351 domain-containing protein [Levilactobacillus brevis]|uniref:DUF1351 domain-containing protein n=1 Tax=Levilactobacillus brevis TaxID=1580 RepID=UPI000BEA67CE|nr:DUF1351 domain-containing protein [Levilactobacillus brevis]MCZ2118601.1 DUF1351 domain-containing protein [Levilactobacillus brevis]MCZ2124215.1 DUF1351 domain-containing protein [Levilactobacillus brevis]MCZ2208535.1 DUF1351 domain-containing protein [Levilactobacillus brevis]MCZ2323999.1 DUF1351 domain-containing protein [Levilactobacillus brevis]